MSSLVECVLRDLDKSTSRRFRLEKTPEELFLTEQDLRVILENRRMSLQVLETTEGEVPHKELLELESCTHEIRKLLYQPQLETAKAPAKKKKKRAPAKRKSGSPTSSPDSEGE